MSNTEIKTETAEETVTKTAEEKAAESAAAITEKSIAETADAKDFEVTVTDTDEETGEVTVKGKDIETIVETADPDAVRRPLNRYLVDIEHERLSFFTPAGEVKALNDVTIRLKEGEVLGIVGESGSGKSVTAYSLMGLTAYPGRLVGGTLEFNGHIINDMSEKEFRKIRGNEISIIFQDPMTSLNPVYTIGNQLEEAILLHTDKNKKQAKERAKELLELVGINEPEKRLKQYPHEHSGGMRQRVMIAMALACEPKLLIADEPTTALDVTIQAQILELMMDLKDKLGMAIIIITHDLGIVASMCERIAVMYAGRIVEYGTTDDIFYNPRHEYTKGLIRSIPRMDIKDHERLVPIEGTPVDMLNPPAGCPFAPRCDKCMKICLREMPPVTKFDDIHYTQCWMNQKEDMGL